VDSLPDSIYFKDTESRFLRLSRYKVEQSREILLKRYQTEHPNETELPEYLTDTDKCTQYLIGKTDFDVSQGESARSAFEQEVEIVRTGVRSLVNWKKQFTNSPAKRRGITRQRCQCGTTREPLSGLSASAAISPALKEAEAQLEQVHQRLIETSRLAGMAEVATDVPAQCRQRPQQRQRLLLAHDGPGQDLQDGQPGQGLVAAD